MIFNQRLTTLLNGLMIGVDLPTIKPLIRYSAPFNQTFCLYNLFQLVNMACFVRSLHLLANKANYSLTLHYE
ncbi:hypothetical protein M23134_02903 [Microscilla marina ATCC 23134]|uniref:Uncharacterized protein n=1 Tax=Microscilla marina ATCC 23134 TaxID=313606 RepID=A1ZSA4_MICM2|nr:hypothetical protein M23134_02903 [Microscilla marina ATCC 23134]